jgi:hypothetical protein
MIEELAKAAESGLSKEGLEKAGGEAQYKELPKEMSGKPDGDFTLAWEKKELDLPKTDGSYSDKGDKLPWEVEEAGKSAQENGNIHPEIKTDILPWEGDANASNRSSIQASEKDDADSGTETDNDSEKGSNESENSEELRPEDYLTEEQIDAINKKYKELGYSDEEIKAKLQEYAKKAKECSEAEEKGLDNLDSKQKGNYGEMKTDLDMLDKGYVRISKEGITSLDDKGHRGIDGVYENPDGEPKYIIVDSKYGSSQLSDTKDGKQMSDEWIDKRLDEAVGKDKADEIRVESIENPDNVGKAVAHIDSEGNVIYTDVDSSEEGDNSNEQG